MLVVSQNTVNKSFSTRRTKQNSLQIKMFVSNCAIGAKNKGSLKINKQVDY